MNPRRAARVGERMKQWTRAFASAVLVAVVVAGCASLPRAGGVAVNLVSVVPQMSSLFETSAALTLRFTNEGTEPLRLTGSSHRIFLNGTYVGRAVTSESIAIPRLGTATQTMTAHLENLVLMRKAQELGNVPAVDYRIESRLHPADERGTIGATASGELDLSGLLEPPPARPAGR